MNLFAACSLSILVLYAIAVATVLIVWMAPRGKVALAWTLAGTVALCPLLIPSNEILARALISVLCADAWFKVTDLARVFSKPRSRPILLDHALLCLIPFPTFLAVYEDRRYRPLLPIEAIDIGRVAIGGPLAVLMFLSLRWLAHVPALQDNFLLDHLVKLVLFVIAIEILAQLMLGIERLAGFNTTPIMRRAFLSVTVGEFWSRYNTRVHRWLQCNVFIPSGGRRSRAYGVCLVFFVSAVFHELMFDIATSRIDGYQFAFFMLQAPAVLVSQSIERLRPRYGPIVTGVNRSLTILWFAATSILFFRGVDRVFPNYYASTPWLP